MNKLLNSKDIEDFNYKQFENEIPSYGLEKNSSQEEYFQKLVRIKLECLRKYAVGKKVLDVGCGKGDYLFELKDIITSGCGIDFTDKAIEAANAKKELLTSLNLEFVKANAKELPFEAKTFDLVFSFSALVAIPKVEKVILEIERVLRTQGIAILEMGNSQSLNTIVSRAHIETTIPCHIRVSEMKKILSQTGFTILDWESFQILPFWGMNPQWLRPLLNRRWKALFQKEIKGKMLDEWVSNNFLFKPFAYRHLIICRKG